MVNNGFNSVAYINNELSSVQDHKRLHDTKEMLRVFARKHLTPKLLLRFYVRVGCSSNAMTMVGM